jgi:hypothetical protein
MDGWISWYTLTADMPPAVYRALARAAEVHLFHETDNTLYANQSYVTLCAEKAGDQTISFPKPVNVFDPFSGQILQRNTTKYRCPLRANETLTIRYKGS